MEQGWILPKLIARAFAFRGCSGDTVAFQAPNYCESRVVDGDVCACKQYEYHDIDGDDDDDDDDAIQMMTLTALARPEGGAGSHCIGTSTL